MRQVDNALLDLKACREQDALGKELLENCLGQRASLNAIAAERGAQLDSFKAAFKAQQDVAGTEKKQLARQLETAQGGWAQRTWEKVDGPVLLLAGLAIGWRVAR